MGSALGRALSQSGRFRVLTYLEGRSPSTRERASKAGLHEAELREITSTSSIIISVVPPSEAIAVARSLVTASAKGSVDGGSRRGSHSTADTRPLFIDANAISPASSQKVADLVAGSFRYVDGCIIGGQ